MTMSKKAVRLLPLILAAFLVLVPSLGALFADDAAPQTPKQPENVQPAPAKAEADTTAVVEPGCATDLKVPELAVGRTSPWQMNTEEQLCPAPHPIEELFPVHMGPPFKHGFCACGCGIQCQTDADCGVGGSCIGAITCC